MLRAAQRQATLKAALETATEPLIGRKLAQEYGVSRQIIVQDIAVLRARGLEVMATPQGYMLQKRPLRHTAVVACQHNEYELMRQELYTVVDHGGVVVDVTVEHPVYGEIAGYLMLSNRVAVDRFMDKLQENQAQPLASTTGGFHLHTLQAPDEKTLQGIIAELEKLGVITNKETAET